MRKFRRFKTKFAGIAAVACAAGLVAAPATGVIAAETETTEAETTAATEAAETTAATEAAETTAATEAAETTAATEAAETTAATEAAEETPDTSKQTEDTETKLQFDDVQDKEAFFFNPVYWALDNEITTGFTETQFKPDDTVTRGQMVTFIWRLAKKPAASAEAKGFSDVTDKEQAFYNAILWAQGEGITTGYEDAENTFGQDDTCTRGQIVTLLWRYKGEPAAPAATEEFADVTKDGNKFYDAIQWAYGTKVTTGYKPEGEAKANTFGQDDDCTRAQGVTFIYRLENAKPADENPEPTEPSTEATEPSTEATEPSTEATEPSTEATEPSTEATEPSTEATEPSTEATEPSTEATEPSTEATEPSTEATEPSTEATEPSTEAAAQ